MAVTPSGILTDLGELTDDEKQQVDSFEKDADKYLIQNWYEDGACIWSAPDPLSLNQLREFCRRYREAGWHLSVWMDEVGLTVTFRKGVKSDVKQITGKAN